MLKINGLHLAGSYLEIELCINDNSKASIVKNIDVLKEVLDFIEYDSELKNLDSYTITLIKNELTSHIKCLEWNANALKTLENGGESDLINQHKITRLSLNGKIAREYGTILRLFNAKLNMNNTLMNLGFVKQY
ncbi:hypothetical protein [Staphylococcus equorum]|uniref:hypothetical protein n=1 Tax=Staphylococcus equorum TaxID=246432 RepID=UPI000853EAF6|nr:hypothetical protein [Staphylococcus equorum]OEL08256.1 hypothetical protein AST04_08710 [Staphylococcus equorum]